MKKISTAVALSLALSGNAFCEETYYVNDILTITLRSGEGTDKKIIRTLKSGTKLDVIKVHKDTGYSLVRLNNGTEGWALSRFLVKNPIARDQLKSAKTEIKSLRNELSKTKTAFDQSDKTRRSLDKSSNTLEKQNNKLSKALAQIRETSANAIAIAADNKTMKTKLIHIETELLALEQQNMILQDRSARDWFVAGTGVTLLGIIIGLLAPKMRFRKKQNWNEL